MPITPVGVQGSNVIPLHMPVLYHDLNAIPGLFHLLHFLLHRAPSGDLRVTPLRAFPLAFSVGQYDDGGSLADDMANPPRAPPD